MAILIIKGRVVEDDAAVLETLDFKWSESRQRWESKNVGRPHIRALNEQLPHIVAEFTVPEKLTLHTEPQRDPLPDKFWVASNIAGRTVRLTTTVGADKQQSIAAAIAEAVKLGLDANQIELAIYLQQGTGAE